VTRSVLSRLGLSPATVHCGWGRHRQGVAGSGRSSRGGGPRGVAPTTHGSVDECCQSSRCGRVRRRSGSCTRRLSVTVVGRCWRTSATPRPRARVA